MNYVPLPSAATLRALLRYEPDTGKLYYRKRGPKFFSDGRQSAAGRAAIWNGQFAGKEAFSTLTNFGYLRGWIDGVNYMAHRVIWKMETGEEPDQIDHIDGSRSNNRFANLRSVNRVENGRNRGVGCNNTSGCVGVSYHRRIGAWMAQIAVHGRRRHLGYFANLGDAVAARKQAESELGFHHNHGSCRAEKARAA